MAKLLHPKIVELQKRASLITYSSYTTKDGSLIDMKVSIDDAYILRGYLAVWGVPDDYGTVAIRGCFAKSIQERGPQSNAKCKIAFLWSHDLADPIGQLIELEEDDYGLRFAAQLDKGVESAERAKIQYGSGTLNQFSYGFDYVWDKMIYEERTGFVLMNECELWEGSCVTIGSNIETYAIRSREDFDNKAFELRGRAEALISSISIPKNKQLELRQLLANHITLYSNKPDDLTKQVRRTLDLSIKPDAEGLQIGGYKLNLNAFSK